MESQFDVTLKFRSTLTASMYASSQTMHSKRPDSALQKMIMTEIFKKYDHAPPHLFKATATYFITGATYEKRHTLRSDAAKEKTVEYMFKSFAHFGWKIEDWVLLNNHYHLMARAPEDANTLANVINNFHKFSGNWIKKHVPLNPVPEKIWHNYWDTCITYENSYFARINYIWFNPVKHKLVLQPEEWHFGSYFTRVNSGDAVDTFVKKYPFDDLKIKDDF